MLNYLGQAPGDVAAAGTDFSPRGQTMCVHLRPVTRPGGERFQPSSDLFSIWLTLL